MRYINEEAIGDASADRVTSFEVTVGPITMTPSSGSAVTVLSGTRRLELTHLSGTNEPLALLDVPQGSYSSASMTVSSPEVTFINSLGAIVKLEPTFNKAISVNFSPALTVGATSMVVSIDLNVANSLTFDSQGDVTGVSLSASSFGLGTSTVAADDKQGHDDGELEDTTGTITAVNGSSFTLTVGQNGVPLVFATDASTAFDDGASLTVNTIVTVEGITKSDGTLYAKEVEGIEDSSGVEAEGLITRISGTQISFLADDGLGSGMDDTKVGGSITADISTAKYKVNKGNIDTSGIGGLPAPPTFPFDASTIHAGQRIEVESANALAGTSTSADEIKLQQQALVGVVSGLEATTSAGPVTFTLSMPVDSVFAMLSGKAQVTVYWQPGTDLHLALCWRDIDWDRGTIDVVRTLHKNEGQWSFSDTKRVRSRRVVKLQMWVLDLLRKLKGGADEAGVACDSAFTDLIFSTARGEPINEEYLVRKHFKPILREAGLPNIRLYDLRHTSATLALTVGVPPKVVSEQLGHASAAFTLDTYSHVLPHMQEEAAAKMEAALRNGLSL